MNLSDCEVLRVKAQKNANRHAEKGMLQHIASNGGIVRLEMRPTSGRPRITLGSKPCSIRVGRRYGRNLSSFPPMLWGMPRTTISKRLKLGWTFERAITTNPKNFS